MLQKVEIVHNFLDPSPMIWTILKIWKFDSTPPPSDLIWKNFEIRKILDFGKHLSGKKH